MRQKMEYRSYDHDNLEPGRELKINRTVYVDDGNEKIESIVRLDRYTLNAMREESRAKEKAIFERLQDAVSEWEAQAARTIKFDMAIAYISTPAVQHTSNSWKKDGDFTVISNQVYKMFYHIYEKTRYDRTMKKSVPQSYDVTWSISYNAPDHRYHKIDGQQAKPFTDKGKAEKYILGRFKAYAHLFREVSPPVPKEHVDLFCVSGVLLPGYRVEGEDRQVEPDHTAPSVLRSLEKNKKEAEGRQFSNNMKGEKDVSQIPSI